MFSDCKIETWNRSLKKNVLIVGFQVLEHKINVKDSLFLCQIYRITLIKIYLREIGTTVITANMKNGVIKS